LLLVTVLRRVIVGVVRSGRRVGVLIVGLVAAMGRDTLLLLVVK
jgi:hypothetical protein